MQALRGRLYLKDGAIEPWQLTDGRHRAAIDRGSWHLLVLDRDERVCGCARYREYSNDTVFSQLSVSSSTLARCKEWGGRLKAAVDSELAVAQTLELPFVELGGWALTETIRGTVEALRMALTTYALSQALGGGVGISTVTRRHCSASILARIGGRSLEHDGSEIPSYHDEQYKCEMEVLRFSSWAPNPRYKI
ncbi:MAG: hypothetical protein ABI165_16560, partial [Bryobacteraceae bacterium]